MSADRAVGAGGVSTLVDLLQARAEGVADRPAYSYLRDGRADEVHLTFAQLDIAARAIAARLQRLTTPGERAVLFLPQGLDFVSAFFGCLYAGVVAVPAYPPKSRRSLARLQSVVLDCGATIAFTTQDVLSRNAGLLEAAPELACLRWTAMDSIDLALSQEWRPPEIGPGTLAFLQYTSGSTGTPRGVMVSHANLLRNEEAIHRRFEHSEASLVVSWLPLFHDMGLIGTVLQSLYAGVPCVLLSPSHFLESPLSWLRAISLHRATTSGGPDFAYRLCADRATPGQLEGLDLSCWSVAFNGAEPIRAETLDRFTAAFEPCGFRREAFYPAYGLAEATLFAAGGTKADAPRVRAFDAAALERNLVADPSAADTRASRRLVGCGGSLEGQEIAIVDPDSRERRAPGLIGEIWISGPSVAAGYWGRSEESEKTFRAGLAGTGSARFLRTGDLGFEKDGEIFITGRLKDLIIIRGRNIHPQDIERTAEGSHASIRAGCSAAFGVEGDGEERLVVLAEVDRHALRGHGSAVARAGAGLSTPPAPPGSGLPGDHPSDAPSIIGAIRRAIAEEHEVQPHAVALLRHGTIPRTTSGKIRRRACREAWLTGGLQIVAASASPADTVDAGFSADDTPETVDEEILARIWARELGLPAVGLRDDFFALGGDSLLAARIVAGIREAFNVDLPATSLFESPTVAALAGRLRGARRCPHAEEAPLPQGAPSRDGAAPLSSAQERLWFLHQVDPDSPAYNLAIAVRLRGPLDVEALERALGDIAARHEPLRTTIAARHGVPVQTASAPGPFNLPCEDLGPIPDRGREAEAERRAHLEARRPFDLSRGPLARMRLLRLRAHDHVLLVTMHHIVSDGWSMGVFLREMAALYEAGVRRLPPPLLPLPCRYADHAIRQRASRDGWRTRDAVARLRERLAGLPPLELPSDRPRPSEPSSGGSRRFFIIDTAIVAPLRALARREGATLFMTLLAGFQTLLRRYTAQDRFGVGVPVAGRDRAGSAHLIGLFADTMVVPADLSGDPTFLELLARVRDAVLEARAHGDVPFDRLVEAIHPDRSLGRQPLFQVMLALLNDPIPDLTMGGVRVEAAPIDSGASMFDLTLAVIDRGGDLHASLEYSVGLFDEETIARMEGHLLTLLEGIVADPTRRISHLPLMREEERRRALEEGNDTAAGPAGPPLIHERFEARAARAPEAVALVAGTTRVSYRRLNRRANEIARRLLRLGAGPETLVGLLAERSVEMVAGILGVLKAGAAYVPLDPAYPPARLSFMMRDCRSRLLLAQERLAASLPAGLLAEMQVLHLDAGEDMLDDAALPDPRVPMDPRNPAYVMYTSGSTGTPKGVVVQHRSVAAFLDWTARAFRPEELSGVLFSTSICFDLSIFEMFAPLSAGGMVILAENVLLISDLPAASDVTLVNTVPTAMAEIARGGGLPPSVRTVNLAGEALHGSLVSLVYAQPSVQRVFNLYGPTEDTVYSTCGCVPRTITGPPSIGRPVANTRAYLLDDHLRPVPAGVPGEIHLAGEGLARGYLGRPDLTAERFLPDPHASIPGSRMYRTGDRARRRPGGDIEYLGRLDDQVKIRGFRVEPAEIESVLRDHAAVRHCAVAARNGRAEGSPRRLVAYVVLHEGLEAPSDDLRRHLAARFPDHMVPSAFVRVPALPLTPSGKVDRGALPPPDDAFEESAAAFVPPRGTVEKTLARIWGQVLGRSRVGAHDNYFDLGGDSILSLQVVARARESGIRLTLRQIFQHQTVAALAAVVGAAPAVRAERGRPKGDVPLTPIQRWFFERDPLEPHHYNQVALLEIGRDLRPDVLERALEHVIDHHDALRLRFTRGADGWRQTHAGGGATAAFRRVDLSALEAPERGTALRAVASEEQSRLSLADGPLARATHFDLGAGEASRLLLVLHHLVVDAVSWRILLEDLQTATGRLNEGRVIALPPRTTSFQEWAQRLERHARSGALRGEEEYWLAEARRQAVPLPVDHPEGDDTEASSRTVTARMTDAETKTLFEASRLHGAGIEEALLTAVAVSLRDWCGRSHLLLDVEGHGREPLFEDVDLSRSVGWFTTIYPVLLHVDGARRPAEALAGVRGQMRAVPGRGIGHGLLRYLQGRDGVRERLQAMPRAGVCFNYLGRLDQTLPPASGFRWAHESTGPARGPRSRRRHLFEINAAVRGGRLQVDWTYSESRHRRETVDALALSTFAALRALCAAGPPAGARGMSPSDFPDVSLDQSQLDRIVRQVGRGGGRAAP